MCTVYTVRCVRNTVIIWAGNTLILTSRQPLQCISCSFIYQLHVIILVCINVSVSLSVASVSIALVCYCISCIYINASYVSMYQLLYQLPIASVAIYLLLSYAYRVGNPQKESPTPARYEIRSLFALVLQICSSCSTQLSNGVKVTIKCMYQKKSVCE